MRPRLYAARPTMNETAPLAGVGKASANGPHIPAQCKLPANPSTNAVQYSIWSRPVSRTNHDFLIDKIIFVARHPGDAHFPKAWPKICCVNNLNAFAVGRKGYLPIESSG